jgi:hypothetical protein
MSRDRARRLLEVSGSAEPEQVKRAYRRLVRDHHPDTGGDPRIFVALRAAYELLLDEPAPELARGRPSRGSSPHPPTPDQDIDWAASCLVPGDPLDRDALAVRLASLPGDEVTATSRAPGSPLNRVAVHLAGDLSAWLRIGPATDDRGEPVVAIQVQAGTHRARRALDRAPLEGGWLRRRNPSTTVLVTMLRPSPVPEDTAVRIVDRLARLLDAIGWELTTWRMLDTASGSP